MKFGKAVSFMKLGKICELNGVKFKMDEDDFLFLTQDNRWCSCGIRMLDYFAENWELVKEKEDKLMLVHVEFTRAELLPKEEQEKLGAKKGLVVDEFRLSEKEMKEEYIRIINESKKNHFKGYVEYVKIISDSISGTIKKYKKKVIKRKRLTEE